MKKRINFLLIFYLVFVILLFFGMSIYYIVNINLFPATISIITILIYMFVIYKVSIFKPQKVIGKYLMTIYMILFLGLLLSICNLALFLIYMICFVLTNVIIIKSYDYSDVNCECICSKFDKKYINSKTLDINKIDDIKIIPDSEELLEKCWNAFCNVQKAWMNFQYDELSKLCSDELYNQYCTQLKTLEIKGEKNIMSNIELGDILIKNMYQIDKNVYVNINLNAKLVDYIVNKKGKVLRGKAFEYIENDYNLVFAYSLKNSIKCPNCGKVEKNNIKECKYCGTKFNLVPNELILTAKNII